MLRASAAWTLSMALATTQCSRPDRDARPKAEAASPAAGDVEARVTAEWAAIQRRDDAAFGDLLEDDYRAVEVDAAGTRNKAEAVRELQSLARFDYTLSRFESRELAPGVALASYEVFLQFSPSAQVRFLRVYVAEVWRAQGGRWRVVHHQETRVR